MSTNTYHFADVLNMNELIGYSTYINVESVYSNYFINIPFKLIGESTTSMTYFYAIKNTTNVKSFITIMKDIIKKDFNIDMFDIVLNTIEEKENGKDLTQSIIQLFGDRNQEDIAMYEIINNSTSFYVRHIQNPAPQPSPLLPPLPPTEEQSSSSNN